MLFAASVGALMILFVMAPVMIAWAPYESTMGLVQKIFYFHVPSWWVLGVSCAVCGVSSLLFLFRNKPAADRVAVAAAELTVLFGLFGLITGPLWALRSWAGNWWWNWDPRLTITFILWMVFVAYLLLRKYGGAGSDKLSAVVGLFGTALVPFVYWSVNIWDRGLHPTTNVVPTLGPGMRGAFWWCAAAFLLLYMVVLTMRVRLEHQRAEVERLYVALEE